jgi:SAM-dependent MidA family methyltransferase
MKIAYYPPQPHRNMENVTTEQKNFIYRTALQVLHSYKRKPPEKWLFYFQADEKRDHVEVCAESGVILEHLASRLEEDGGFALFADYGHDGTKSDTFRVSFMFLSKIFLFTANFLS